MKIRSIILLSCCLLLLGACQIQATPAQVEEPIRSATVEAVEVATNTPLPPTATLLPALPTSAASATTAPSPTLTFTVAPSATPDVYQELTIDWLTERSYGGGELQIQEVLADNSYFTRYLITYPSDGLTIYGFMNVPKRDQPPYPVVIALHGYIDPAIYTTLDYTTGNADALARSGFLVIHPNLRGYPPSQEGDNLFRVGMAIDVLNLIAIVEAQGGSAGPLELAIPGSIGLWGHSMGGGITTRVITINPRIRAAVLYGAMSGDEHQNYKAIYAWSEGERGNQELAVPEEELGRISPIYYLPRISAAVSIHHGEADNLVPLAWSLDTCARLTELGKIVECYTYPGQPHTFHDEGEALFNERVIDFFNLWLRDN